MSLIPKPEQKAWGQGSGHVSIVFKQPDCYKANNNPYPLCTGNGSTQCLQCCLYENMDERYSDK